MSRNPIISVLTSCYNATDYLSEAIESILSQTFGDFEFILIDDGSTDNTNEVIKRYEAKDSRIVTLEKRNTGLADSLNEGIKIARGEWIARLDSDDVALPRRLEKQLSYVRKYPEIVLAGAGCIIINNEGLEIKRYKYPSGNRKFINHLIKGGSPFPHSTAFYKTEAVRRLGGYRPRIYRAEDKDLWLRLSIIGEIGCMPDHLIKLRKHAQSITAMDGMCAITSFAAMVSFLLVQAGKPDPVEQREPAYHLFLQWLEKQLVENGYFVTNLVLEAFRESFTVSPQSAFFKRLLRMSKIFLSLPQAGKIIKEKFFGSELSIKLVKEWCKIHG